MLDPVSNGAVLHERVILLTVVIEPVAKIEMSERLELTELADGFCRVVLRYGFMQWPNVPSELAGCEAWGLKEHLEEIHYFIGHVDMFAGRRLRRMANLRDQIFVFMASNTQDATAYRRIPVAQTMKVGLLVGI